jgi:FkbM family methyltransferase
MRRLVTQPNPVLFDVGANIGQTALHFRSLFPDAAIHCFEPFPESYRALCSSLGSDARTATYMIALSDTPGFSRLKVNRSRATNSLLPSDHRASHYWGDNLLDTDSEITVPTQTVDAFCKEQGIEHIHVLKLDVQGAEYAVLSGTHQMLSHQAIDLIYMEMITAPTYVGQRRLHEYLALFDSCQYELFGVYNLVHCNGRLIQTDNIMVSARFLNDYERL